MALDGTALAVATRATALFKKPRRPTDSLFVAIWSPPMETAESQKYFLSPDIDASLSVVSVVVPFASDGAWPKNR